MRILLISLGFLFREEEVSHVTEKQLDLLILSKIWLLQIIFLISVLKFPI